MYHTHQFASLHSLMVAGCLCFFLNACSDGPNEDAASRHASQVLDAATGPLEDLNFKRKEIPELLDALRKNPYAPPKTMKCEAIKEELAQLDTLLGPDMDLQARAGNVSPASLRELEEIDMPSTEKIIDTGGDLANDGLLNFIRDQTDILPFRSVFRFVSGADRHARDLRLSIQAGQLRRAYLKGLADAHFGSKCLAPPLVAEGNAASTS